MSDLDNIQLDIVIGIQGLDSVQRLTGALGRLNTAQGKVNDTQKATASTNYRAITSWGDLSGHLTKVEQSLDAVWRAGVHLKALGNDLIGISKNIIGTGMGIVETYADYDYWLRRAGVALNTNAKYHDLLDDSIKRVAIQVGLLKPEQVAEAFNIWGAATGVVVDDMDSLQYVAGTVRDVILATAGAGGSLEQNLKGVSAILGQFNMGMGDAAHVVRVLTLMTERTQADFGDLSQSFSYIGPLAHSLGITFDDVAQILGVLADSGQRGSRAGRGLSMVIEGLSAPSEKAAAALDLVVNGFKKGKREWKDVAFPKGDFIGMEGVVTELAKGLFNASDAQRGYVYSVAFSNNATRALIPLVERTIELWRKDAKAMREGKTALDDTKYSLSNAGAFFENMSTQMTESINAVIGSFKNSFFPIIQLVAVRIMELAKPVLGFLQKQLEGISEWLKSNQWAVDLAVQVGAVIAVATALAGIFFSIIGTLLLLGAGVAFFVKGLSGITFAFGLLASVIAGIAAAIAQDVGGIRTALSGLFDEIGRLFDPAVKAFNEFAITLSDLPGIVGPNVEGVFRGLAAAINVLTDALRTINNDPALRGFVDAMLVGLGVWAAWTVSLRTIGGLVASFAGFVWAATRTLSGLNIAAGALITLPGPLKLLGVLAGAAAAIFYAWENNLGGFRDIVMGIVNWLTSNLPGAVSMVQGIFDAVVTKGGELLSVAVPALQGFVSSVTSLFGQLWSAVAPILEAIWAPFGHLIEVGIPALISLLGQLVGAWVPVFQQIAEVVIGVFVNQIIPAIGQFLATITEHLMPLLAELWEYFKVIWNGIVSVVALVLGSIIKEIIQFVTTIAPYVGGFLELLIRLFGSTFGAVLNIVATVLTSIMDVVRGVLEIIRGIVTTVLGLIKGDWTTVWNGIKLFVSGVFTLIKGIIEGALGVIGGIIDTGLRIVSGIFEFIFGTEPGSIYSKIVGFLTTAINFGGQIITNLYNGVAAAFSWAVNAIGTIIGGILGAIGDFITGKRSGGGGGGIFNTLLDIGKNIVFGLWEGIQRMFQWMIDKITGFISSVIPGPIKDFLGISSPSKMMADLGEYIVLGLAQGITNSDAALIAMERQATQLAAVAEGGADRISLALDSAVAASSGTGISVTTANKKTIRLEVEVTSPDGSVDSLTAEQLADLIKGPDLVSALEHMASTDI